MKKKNLLVTATATVLALTMAFGGTFAYLTATSDEVENDFKTNSNDVALTETPGDYDIVPGTSQAKDPTVTATYTLDSYVYVEVTDNTQGLVTYEIADDWTKLGSYTNDDGETVTVYYQLVSYVEDGATDGVCTSDLYVLKGNTVYYPSSITNADMDAAENVSLTFKAYIVQANYEGEVDSDNDCVLYGLSLTEYENYTAIVANSKLVTEIAAVAATCNETGLTVGYKCADCDKVLVAQEVVPATGHGYSYVAAVDATCTDEGTTEGYICPDCGKRISGLRTVGALGHEFGEDGVCTRCGEVAEMKKSGTGTTTTTSVSSADELLAAIEEAAENGTTCVITLTGDIALDDDLEISSTVALNLNGYTLTADITAEDGAVLAISNGTVSGTVTVNSGYVVVSEVTMTGDHTKFKVNGGYLTINSGTYVYGSSAVIDVDGGNLIVNGGSFTGHTFVSASAGSVTINGGTFDGWYVVKEQSESTASISITGGTYSINVLQQGATDFVDYIADGYTYSVDMTSASAGTYTVSAAATE